MFKRQETRIIKDLYLRAPIHESADWDLDFFDREGFSGSRWSENPDAERTLKRFS